ncbi:MoaD/ThiS family protein [Aspergillus mulundensis]|uniref:Molybdopterin synthase sulfur carrier subunit n=1 Tax=Aspergillus mulundensis TaxID=1810919 RepID=A0A3D8QHL2_9EURO|nr:Molybdopterin synthase sulfur carrier subunit [Aspergillus mulundensis]RDW61188.1 Molybdopterin synthase sulfur carrier subunit [Aspergillus mulundensis]
MSTFQVHYFASASSYTGKNTESLPAPLPLSKLFDTLEANLGDEYVDMEADGSGSGNEGIMIQNGDEVAVIPPVSSG